MNKYQEAFKELRKLEQEMNTWDTNCNELEELIERATPKKVKSASSVYGDNLFNNGVCYCPNCNREIKDTEHDNFCSNCGQAIELEDYD